MAGAVEIQGKCSNQSEEARRDHREFFLIVCGTFLLCLLTEDGKFW